MCFLLQVNGINLLGENHQDVVNILKELPIDVTMVCCRRTVPSTAASELDSLDISDLELTEKVSGLQRQGLLVLKMLRRFNLSLKLHFFPHTDYACRVDLEFTQPWA